MLYLLDEMEKEYDLLVECLERGNRGSFIDLAMRDGNGSSPVTMKGKSIQKGKSSIFGDEGISLCLDYIFMKA